MSVEENKALWRRWVEEMNKGKGAALAAMDEIFATDFVAHGTLGDIRGLDYKQHTSEYYDAFHDAHMTIDDMVTEGDKVAVCWTWTGTHKATSKKVTMWQIDISRIAGGKFVQKWARYDTLGYKQQLGVIPTPKK